LIKMSPKNPSKNKTSPILTTAEIYEEIRRLF